MCADILFPREINAMMTQHEIYWYRYAAGKATRLFVGFSVSSGFIVATVHLSSSSHVSLVPLLHHRNATANCPHYTLGEPFPKTPPFPWSNKTFDVYDADSRAPAILDTFSTCTRSRDGERHTCLRLTSQDLFDLSLKSPCNEKHHVAFIDEP